MSFCESASAKNWVKRAWLGESILSISPSIIEKGEILETGFPPCKSLRFSLTSIVVGSTVPSFSLVGNYKKARLWFALRYFHPFENSGCAIASEDWWSYDSAGWLDDVPLKKPKKSPDRRFPKSWMAHLVGSANITLPMIFNVLVLGWNYND